jgi:phosphatidylinositol glycan class B
MMMFLIAYRIVNALIVNTYFSADEYYQSVEVAHKHVFQHTQCNDTLTWEWQPQIALRGYLHPTIFTILYYVMKQIGVTNSELYVIAPRMLQALSSAGCDYGVYLLARKWYPKQSIAKYALLASVTNWFHFYCGVRTFSNSLETTITVLTCVYYPYYPMSMFQTGDFDYDDTTWLWFAGLGCVLRPTSAIIWLPLYVIQMTSVISNRRKGLSNFMSFLVKTIGYVVFWLGLSVLLDSYMYGRWTFVVFEFLKFNVFENRSHLYGVQPWHWYFSQGFPVISFTQFPFFLYVIGSALFTNSNRAANRAILLIIYVLAVYSLFAHKEFRFIYPILPLSFVFIGKVQSSMFKSSSVWKRFIVVASIVLQVIMAFYFSRIHQSGTIAATAALRSKQDVSSVYFMVPCHHAPSYSYLYNYDLNSKNVQLRHLDCSPCFGNCTNYEEEQDIFYRDPELFLSKQFEVEKLDLPSHIVLYEDLLPRIQSFVNKYGYKKTDQLFHMHYPHVHDRRMSEHVLILQRLNNE